MGDIVHNWRENYDINEETPADIANSLQERIDNLQEAIDTLESIDVDDLNEKIADEIEDALGSVEV